MRSRRVSWRDPCWNGQQPCAIGQLWQAMWSGSSRGREKPFDASLKDSVEGARASAPQSVQKKHCSYQAEVGLEEALNAWRVLAHWFQARSTKITDPE